MFRSSLMLCTSALALGLVTTLPADAASQRRGSAHQGQTAQSSETDRLNEMSLQRARQGTDAPTPGADTTSNLNRMSDQDARQGRAMPQPPMPYR
ncbi:hypothetical protein [Siccirubricoccus sp. G192]|uniref:hypothetical protein n=1 Tax=Siccirubricoccus sp. G192 TaxID=2849651 RepID=UPI001C2C9794|nr:hypothetical protein [Siccirubricoccus sp. G192]MBV1799596.1 hypothetical protein [Siccirubricoccus sp. G192]